jgi:hypothetical protein
MSADHDRAQWAESEDRIVAITNILLKLMKQNLPLDFICGKYDFAGVNQQQL